MIKGKCFIQDETDIFCYSTSEYMNYMYLNTKINHLQNEIRNALNWIKEPYKYGLFISPISIELEKNRIKEKLELLINLQRIRDKEDNQITKIIDNELFILQTANKQKMITKDEIEYYAHKNGYLLITKTISKLLRKKLIKTIYNRCYQITSKGKQKLKGMKT